MLSSATQNLRKEVPSFYTSTGTRAAELSSPATISARQKFPTISTAASKATRSEHSTTSVLHNDFILVAITDFRSQEAFAVVATVSTFASRGLFQLQISNFRLRICLAKTWHSGSHGERF